MCSPTPYQYNGIAKECAEEGSAIITEVIEERKLAKIAELKKRFVEACKNDTTHTQRLSMLGTESESSYMDDRTEVK